jgi:hypothetical protein
MGRGAPSRRGLAVQSWGEIVLAVIEVSDIVRGVLRFGGFFDFHVAKLLGIKDFATIQTLDEFRVFVPGHNTYSRVFAGGGHRSIWLVNCSSRPIVAVLRAI